MKKVLAILLVTLVMVITGTFAFADEINVADLPHDWSATYTGGEINVFDGNLLYFKLLGNIEGKATIVGGNTGTDVGDYYIELQAMEGNSFRNGEELSDRAYIKWTINPKGVPVPQPVTAAWTGEEISLYSGEWYQSSGFKGNCIDTGIIGVAGTYSATDVGTYECFFTLANGNYQFEDGSATKSAILTISCPGHTTTGDYHTDEISHWLVCDICGSTYDSGEHTGGEATYTEQAVCDTCGQPYGELKQKQASQIVMLPCDSEVEVDTIFLLGCVLTADGGPITGVTVRFYEDGEYIGSVDSSEIPVIFFQWKTDDNREHEYVAKFEGNDEYNACESVKPTIVNVYKLITPPKYKVSSIDGDGIELDGRDAFPMDNNFWNESITKVEGDVKSRIKGTHTFTASPQKGYKFSTGEESILFYWNYKRRLGVIPVPTENTAEFIYNGTEQSYGIEETDYYTVTNGKQTEAGEYEVIIKLKEPGLNVWASGNELDDIVFKWTIKKNKVPIPMPSSFTYPYTGKAIYFDIAHNDKLYWVQKDHAIEANGYYTFLCLKDDRNYEWDSPVKDGETGIDGISIEGGACLYYNWQILPQPVELEIPDTTDFDYDGEEKTVLESTDYYTVSGAVETEPGVYEVTLVLKDKFNFRWPDGTTEPIKLKWRINAREVGIPEENTINFTYSGEEQNYGITETEDYTVTGEPQTNAGIYQVIISLKDKTGTTWTNGSMDDIVYEWTIEKKAIDVPVIPTEKLVYNGTEQTFEVESTPDYTVTGNKGTNAGTYQVKIELKDDTNTKWADDSEKTITKEWTIEKKSITVPEDSKSYVYSGTPQAFGITSTPDYTVTDGMQQNVGEYDVVVDLTDKQNSFWADGTTDAKHYKWVISKPAKTVIPASKFSITLCNRGQNDGRISGVDSSMEYSTDKINWTNCPDGTITGLAEGTYYIRYMETPNTGASEPTTVTVYASSYVISIKSTGNGTCSPMGVVTVTTGGTQTINFIPSQGYGVTSVTVDGQSVGTPTAYVFSNIKANHTVEVTFGVGGNTGTTGTTGTTTTTGGVMAATTGVKTGDESNIMLWTSLLMLTTAAMFVVVLYNKKKVK